MASSSSWWSNDPDLRWEGKDNLGDRVVVRLIGDSEYPAIETLSKDIYRFEGIPLDYLVAKFKRYAAASTHFSIGVFLFDSTSPKPEEELVGYTLYAFIDAGKTLFRQALRILPKHRNRGLKFCLVEGSNSFLPTLIARLYPQAFRIRDAKGVFPQSTADGAIGEKRTLLFPTTDLLHFITQCHTTVPPGFECRKVGFVEAHHFLQQHLSLLIRPAEGRPAVPLLLVDWVAYEPTLENLALVQLGGRSEWEREFYVIKHGSGIDTQYAFCAVGIAQRAAGAVLDVEMYSDDALCCTAFLHTVFDDRTGSFWRSSPLCQTSEQPPLYTWLWFDSSFRDAFAPQLAKYKNRWTVDHVYIYDIGPFPMKSKL